MTSQSIMMVFSPSALTSMTARRDRPMRREISWVRPPILPRTLSRSLRVLVARGSIAYSAVTQPSPEPVFHRGTPCVNDAEHSTRVPPKLTRHEPSALRWNPRSKEMGRSWSGARPSARVTLMAPSLSGLAVADPLPAHPARAPRAARPAPGSDAVHVAGDGQHGIGPRLARLLERELRVHPRRHMRHDEPAGTGLRRHAGGLASVEVHAGRVDLPMRPPGL